MPEKIINNPEESKEKQSQLVDQAVAAFEKKDVQGLDQAVLKLGQELGVELETKHEEMIKKSQLMSDFLFGQGQYDLRKEYLDGNIQLFTPEEEKALKKEGYREFLIIDGKLSREEIEKAINAAYQEKIPGYQGIWYSGQAKEDLSKTQAAEHNPRPQGFYIIALRPGKETIDAYPETASKTLEQQLAILHQAQEKHPDLNLKGMTLSEAMLFDAYILAVSENQKDHADNSQRKWSYNRCLEELVLDENGKPARALYLRWIAAYSQLGVLSYGHADEFIGSRLAAVSAAT